MNSLKTVLAIILLTFASLLWVSCEKPEPDSPYGEGETSKLKGVTLTLKKVTATKAIFDGTVKDLTPDLIVGVHWNYYPIEHINNTNIVSTYDFVDGRFVLGISDLPSNEVIYYMPYVHRNGVTEYGDCLSFTTAEVTMTVDKVEVMGRVATFTGIADLDGDGGILCSTDPDLSLAKYMNELNPEPYDLDGAYIHKLTDLDFNTTYYYRTYYRDRSAGSDVYGEVKSFKTGETMLTVDNVNISDNVVTFTGNVALDCEGGIFYTTDPDFSDIASCGIIDLSYKSEIPYLRKCSLSFNTTYYYCTFCVRNGEYELGEIKSFTTGSDSSIKDLSLSSATDLSYNGTANCYIVSQSGLYKIKTVKGNDENQILTNATTPELLWETFGTDEVPSRRDLISAVCYKNGYLIFQTANTFREGNAVVAVKDSKGTILWSWHIWLTDKPQEHIYKNNAGTMMDRNLGATSATAGDVGALGLLYQWGRKDPFLGSSSISESIEAESTIVWPLPLDSSTKETTQYLIAHPTTFIDKWYEDSIWQSEKNIYDPCPVGWRVPDGGDDGVWAKAGFGDTTFDRTNQGISFSISSPSTTWYPASGFRSDSGLSSVGGLSDYWSCSFSDFGIAADCLRFDRSGYVDPLYAFYCERGLSVRCIKD
ncbi:MAG: hypothetical protein J6C35_04530 [Bacteroidales bacterium]|nr:hypothetical protein [Bacteroidales bacterium]